MDGNGAFLVFFVVKKHYFKKHHKQFNELREEYNNESEKYEEIEDRSVHDILVNELIWIM